MTATVQLILPGLFDLPLQELEAGFVDTELPCLNRILRLASVRANQAYSIDAILRNALALRASDTSLPVAWAFAGSEQQGARLMLVEAIHLQADLHSAIAMPIPDSEENSADISLIINDLVDIFNVDFDISALPQGPYLLHLKEIDPPMHYPHPLSVLGKSISPFIEQSRQVLPWYRLLNEIQMFMHQHPVNERRTREGKLAINSLWTWGAGSISEDMTANRERTTWFCDDPVLNGFAQALGLTVESCSDLAKSKEAGHSIIVDLRLQQFLKGKLNGRLDQILSGIETLLLAPLLKDLVRCRLPLLLRAGYRVDFEMKPSARFKFWRRPASLVQWQN